MEFKDWYGIKVLECNTPDTKPGVYAIIHMPTGSAYIGASKNVAKRIREHYRNAAYRKTRIGEAIADLGAENFMATILYKPLSENDRLEPIEAEFIAMFDSVNAGYNTIESSVKGTKRGELFCKVAKASKYTPEAIANRNRILADEDITKRRGDAIRAAQARPEVKEKLRNRARSVLTEAGLQRIKLSQIEYQNAPEVKERKSVAMLRHHADPEFKEKHLKGIREANANPERNSKISNSRKGGMWITNGLDTSFIRSGVEIPEGWWRGQTRPKKAA